MCHEGKDVNQDYKAAVKWYKLAAEQGFALAQNNLGGMYYEGKGTLQDYTRAYVWFYIAASLGNGDARKNRDIVEKKMTPAQIAEAQKLAREWTPKGK